MGLIAFIKNIFNRDTQPAAPVDHSADISIADGKIAYYQGLIDKYSTLKKQCVDFKSAVIALQGVNSQIPEDIKDIKGLLRTGYLVDDKTIGEENFASANKLIEANETVFSSILSKVRTKEKDYGDKVTEYTGNRDYWISVRNSY